ncbi:hypothetical protein C6A77_04590 [Pseudomonas sp. AFG_SD02_1510_Pfu_092]|nr:hypothetical protein C6A77_04590 [Pseudomonas sp. AFG_SD02_1510_Pfu_092]
MCSGFGSGWLRGIDSTCSGLFAGKPAPTGICKCSSVLHTCGSGRAREEAGTGDTNQPPVHESME